MGDVKPWERVFGEPGVCEGLRQRLDQVGVLVERPATVVEILDARRQRDSVVGVARERDVRRVYQVLAVGEDVGDGGRVGIARLAEPALRSFGVVGHVGRDGVVASRALLEPLAGVLADALVEPQA